MAFLQSPITPHIVSYSLITEALVCLSQTCANIQCMLRQGILQDFSANLNQYHVKKVCLYSTIRVILLPQLHFPATLLYLYQSIIRTHLGHN